MTPILAKEGWFVSHLFFKIHRKQWDQTPADKKRESLIRFKSLVTDFRLLANCQCNCYAIWGLKADFGVMLVDPDLQHLSQIEYAILSSFSPGVLERVDSFISMSEVSEYMSQEVDYDRTLRTKEGLNPESPEYQEKMAAFRSRMQVYIDDRLYPKVPEHRVFCFYPMSKQRGDKENWYLLDFETRKRYMTGHSITGRKFQATVRQLVTGSIGLDDWEWGVTLFADDPYYFKKILYEMRYDEASARFGEFGRFYIGIRLEPDGLFEHLMI